MHLNITNLKKKFYNFSEPHDLHTPLWCLDYLKVLLIKAQQIIQRLLIDLQHWALDHIISVHFLWVQNLQEHFP